MMNKATLRKHCLEYTHPNFRGRVKECFNVVVAAEAFGCGLSRDVAVSALSGRVICPYLADFVG
jgi:3-isopropylmalate dehydratase small subunit